MMLVQSLGSMTGHEANAFLISSGLTTLDKNQKMKWKTNLIGPYLRCTNYHPPPYQNATMVRLSPSLCTAASYVRGQHEFPDHFMYILCSFNFYIMSKILSSTNYNFFILWNILFFFFLLVTDGLRALFVWVVWLIPKQNVWSQLVCKS